MFKGVLRRVLGVFLAAVLVAAAPGTGSLYAASLSSDGVPDENVDEITGIETVSGDSEYDGEKNETVSDDDTAEKDETPEEDEVVIEEVEDEEPEMLGVVAGSGNCGPGGSDSVRWTLSTEDGGATFKLIINGSGSMKSLDSEIYDKYKGKIKVIEVREGVTKIGDYAFKECGKDLTSGSLTVSLPNSLTKIGYGSFLQCNRLDNIYIPGNVTVIAGYAFSGCSSLKMLCLWGNNQSDKALTIGESAFSGCSSLKSFTFPRFVNKIGKDSFKTNRTIDVYLPAEGVVYGGVAYVGNEAFSTLSEAIKGIGGAEGTVRKDLNITMYGYIGSDLTYNYSKNGMLSINGDVTGTMPEFDSLYDYPWSVVSVSSLYIGDDVVNIGKNAFKNMNALESITVNSAKLASIGDDAFSGCSGLTDLNLKYCRKDASIGERAFADCTRLSGFSLKPTVSSYGSISSIGKEAFRNCKALKTLDLDSMDLLNGQGIFKGCTGLTDLSVNLYNWKTKASWDIPEYTFSGCSSLKNVTINGVNTIKSNAFENCTSLTSFDTGGTKALEKGALNGCANITDFTVGKYLETLGVPLINNPAPVITFNSKENETYRASEDNDLILTGQTVVMGSGSESDVSIPSGTETVGEYAFYNQKGLKTIILPASMKKIEAHAFSGCTNLSKKMVKGAGWASISVLDDNEPIKTASQENYITEGNFAGNQMDWELDDGTLTVIARAQSDIPDFKANDLPPWYHCRTDIKELSGEDVTSVGNYAFYGCRLLQQIVKRYPTFNFGLNTGLTSIGSFAFGNCSSLKDFFGYTDDPESGTPYGVKFDASGGTVKKDAFNGCTALKIIDTRDQKVKLEAGAFNNCPALENINIGNNTEFKAPITDTPNALETLTVADENPNYMDDSEHHYIVNKDTEGKAGNTLLYATKYCTDIPDGIKTIGEGAFYGLSSLESLTIPYSVEEIKDNAFYGCKGLKQVNYMGNKDAWGKITVGKGNDILKSVKINYVATKGEIKTDKGTLAWEIVDKVVSGVTKKTLVLTVKEGSFTEIPDYDEEKDMRWSASATRIERVEDESKKITAVGSYAFSNFTRVTNEDFYLPKLTVAGEAAFRNCDSLENVINPGTIEAIGDSAFADCSGITEISGLDKVKTIGKGAFSGCDSLEKITVPKDVETIGDGVLKDCKKLTDIIVEAGCVNFVGNAGNEILLEKSAEGSSLRIIAVVPSVTSLDLSGFDGITVIGEGAFSGCASLKSIILPDTLKEIGDSAFEECESLESFTVPKNTETIGVNVFTGCKNLKELKSNSEKFEAKNNTLVGTSEPKTLVAGCNGSTGIPDGVEVIGEGAFDGCSAITAVFTFPNSVKKIGKRAFAGCSGVGGEMDLSRMTNVGDSAFEGCELIKKVTLPQIKDGEAFGIGIFKDCTGIDTVRFPAGLAIIPDSTFEGCISLKKVDLPISLTDIGVKAFFGTSLISVNYAGTRSDWRKIRIKEGNDEIKGAEFTCKPDPTPKDYTEDKEPDPVDPEVNDDDTKKEKEPESNTTLITNPVTIKDKEGKEISLNLNIEITKKVSYNGLNHVWSEGKSGKSAVPDITVKISGGIENYAVIKSVKIKNGKNASGTSSKKPAVTITLKPTTGDKAIKKEIKKINKKVLKKNKDLTFEILPMDLSVVKDSIKVKVNGKKTKVKKVTVDIDTGTIKKTVKISKKDFTVDSIEAEKGSVTLTGKGNCCGTVTVLNS